MLAAYDLARSPASYDVVAFLLHIEAERIRCGAEHIDLAILPGPIDGFRNDRFWPHGKEYRKHLLDNVVIPMCHMLPSCRSVMLMTSAPNAFGAGRAMYGFKVMLEAMKVAGRPLRPRKTFPSQDKLITITLREGEHWPTRNSNVDEWLKAAAAFEARGYQVVFVRDAIKADSALSWFDIDPQASCDLDIRAALYASAFCNFFVSNGPAWVAICSDVPAIVMKPTTDGLLACYTRNYFRGCGLVDQLPHNPTYQQIVWKDDTESEILIALEQWRENLKPHDHQHPVSTN